MCVELPLGAAGEGCKTAQVNCFMTNNYKSEFDKVF